jgi:hypothetical protein
MHGGSHGDAPSATAILFFNSNSNRITAKAQGH